ncbi:MAG: MEDS domain-containing protein [Bacteroidia bacterium]
MDNIKLEACDWKNSNIQVFWGEIAPCDHLVQIYENDKYFLDTLEGFAGCGLISGDSVVIIATKTHLRELDQRLRKQGFDLDNLIKENQYIPLDAHEALAQFMVNKWPDETRFNHFISKLLGRAKHDNRKVRAFGEMVAVLWEQGHNGATVQLENLWHQLHSQDKFSLYCAYPKSGFTQNTNNSLDKICNTHSKIIDGQSRPSTEIYYQAVGNL